MSLDEITEYNSGQNTYSLDQEPQMKSLVAVFTIVGAFWLIFGTLVSLYMAFKFNNPDLDHFSWLSFGRLRPIHTNTVFWGWCSISLLSLAYYVIPKVSFTRLYSYKLAWISLILMNLGVISGNTCLFLGITNGAQEYREYIWPCMGLFFLGVLSSGFNFYKTIINRKVEEIYISTWYIFSAILWTTVLEIVAYIPGYQYGISETIIQGYYMHQAVGMWFTPMVLGATYYFVPKLLNKPIYSYSLSILAFWTQLVFYTLIGSHHFIYGPIPWWLQNVSIIFSVGMAVPVVAGTLDIYITMWGSGKQIRRSPELLFIFFGILYYFVGSLEGSLEALRTISIQWHFTNYTVSHSHTTMYGFVNMIIWGCTYALLPKLSNKKVPKFSIWAHLILASVGLLIFEIVIAVGGHYQGQSWIKNKPFIDSVVLMMPYWKWRSVGGTIMFISHLFYFYNIYKIMPELTKKKANNYGAVITNEA